MEMVVACRILAAAAAKKGRQSLPPSHAHWHLFTSALSIHALPTRLPSLPPSLLSSLFPPLSSALPLFATMHAIAPSVMYATRAGTDCACCSMGNPHATFFVDDCEKVPLETIGHDLEHHRLLGPYTPFPLCPPPPFLCPPTIANGIVLERWFCPVPT